MRLDQYLIQNNEFSSRSQAQLAIKENKVKVNGRIVSKSGFEVEEKDNIEVEKSEFQFVSRGGFKLLAAIKEFKINLEDKVVLDIGASTGGFSDCALQLGAKKVYAYDVGHDQLADKIRNNPKVVVKEGVNCRNLKKDEFDEEIDFICMDVSFISCTKMIESIDNILKNNGLAVILFKPQFEVGNQYLNRQGIVINDKIIKEKMDETINYIEHHSLKVIGKMLSPIKGGDGNKEYLLYLRK